MINWKDIYEELKQKRTFFGFADESKEEAKAYFNWLGTKYQSIKPPIQDSWKQKESEVFELYDDGEISAIILGLKSVIEKNKEDFRREGKKQIEGLFRNKSADPLIADFQTIDGEEITHLKNALDGVQLSPESMVFFTNVLVEELYLNVLPKYFNELLTTSQKNLSGLPRASWEEGKKELIIALHNEFAGCESSFSLAGLDTKLKEGVAKLEKIIESAKSSKPDPKQQPITPPVSTPGDGDNVSNEIKEIETEINKFRGQNRTERTDNDRSILIKNLKEKRDWIYTGTENQKKSSNEKKWWVEKGYWRFRVRKFTIWSHSGDSGWTKR